MLTPDITTATSQARQLALLTIAQRCKTDLYYLCKHILGYDLMTEMTHGELCRLTQTLLPNPHSPSTGPTEPPHSPSNEATDGTPAGTIVSLPPGAHTENLATLHVQPTFLDPLSNNGLYQAGISGTLDALDVQDVEKLSERDYDQFYQDRNQLLLLMPRGTFKSSVVTIGFTLQMILQNQDVRILIDSETFAKAKAFLSEIKGHLESTKKYREIYRTLYGSMPDASKRDGLWSDSQLNISARKRQRKEPTLSCGGVDVTKNGMHYDLIIMDDLHSEVNTQNKEQIEKVITHFKLAYSLLDPGKPLIVIGTRWDYNDLYQHILDRRDDYSFNIMVRKAYNKDGSLFFPEILDHKELEKRKIQQGSYIFSCQYLNEPVDDESATFKRSLMVRRPWELVKDQPMNWYLSVDPSYEGPYSDYAALVIAGMNHQRDLYVRHVLRKKMTYGEIINQMFDLYNRFEPRQIILETVATQKSIQHELNNEQKRRGTWLPVTEIRSRTKSKEERIRALAPFYEFGHIFHVRECNQLDELEYELIHFPKGTHDDVIDALSTILEFAQPAGGMEKQKRREKNKALYAALTKPRSPITGV